MHRRALGASGVTLSPIAFGSMRLEVGAFPDAHWLELFHLLADEGITAFHSSHEYESYPRFCRLIRQLRRDRPSAELQHIVKLACPSFDEPAFDRNQFRSAIEKALSALGTERIDVVQWLVRQAPNSDERRLPVLLECLEQVRVEWDRLRGDGKIGALVSFPYTVRFADEILRLDLGDGLASYLNPAETEYAERLDDLLDRKLGFLAIRPMFAGKLFEQASGPTSLAQLGIAPDERAQFCLSFPLLHPAVTTVIVSMSTIAHARQNMAALMTSPDIAEFHRLSRCFALNNAADRDRL